MIGQEILHYRILEKLGSGGMGVVYKAEDLKLKRTVALKFLSQGALGTGEEKVRFVNEARVAAALDHPRICTIYDIGEANGETFIAMAYVEGRTLKSRTESGPMPFLETVDIATQIVEALEEAHRRGLVHRDIKGANIMVNDRGQVKILDFGLAQRSGDTRITKTGMMVGTPAYMAPEQAQGQTVDGRADLWSVGVVIYEMVTGQIPFKGGNAVGMVHSIIHTPHRPMSDLRTGVPGELEHTVSRLLAKRPAERYRTAADLLIDLRALRKELELGSAVTSGTARTAAALPTLAVMPFSDMSAEKDQAYFCEGIAEDVINALNRIEGLRVAPRASSFKFARSSYDVTELGDKLRVGMILEGSVRRSGNRLRITAQLISVADGFPAWSERYDCEMKDIFDVQDEISQAIVNALKVKLVGDQKQLVKRFTDNLEAYNLYLKGRYHWNHRVPGALKKALEYFQQALIQDPSYALAHAGTADCYILAGVQAIQPAHKVMPPAQQAALKALEADDMLAEAHTSLGAVRVLYEFDWAGGEQSFRRALDLNPGYATAHSWFAMWHLAPLGRWEEALREARRARDLEPLSPPVNTASGLVLYCHRDYDAAIRELQHALDLDPNFALANYYQARCWLQKGVRDKAIAAFQRAREVLGNNPGVMGVLGHGYAIWGMTADAHAILDELHALTAKCYVSAHSFGLIYLGLGEFDRAMEWFDKAFEERSALLLWTKVDPVYDPLRSDPRFTRLLQKLNLEPSDPAGGGATTTMAWQK